MSNPISISTFFSFILQVYIQLNITSMRTSSKLFFNDEVLCLYLSCQWLVFRKTCAFTMLTTVSYIQNDSCASVVPMLQWWNMCILCADDSTSYTQNDSCIYVLLILEPCTYLKTDVMFVRSVDGQEELNKKPEIK